MTKITREQVSRALLTPRETTVMDMWADGLSSADILESGKIRALEGRHQAVGRQQIHNIKSKALRKMQRRGLIDPA